MDFRKVKLRFGGKCIFVFLMCFGLYIDVVFLLDSMLFSVYMNISWNMYLDVFEKSKECFLFVQNKGWYGLYRIEETKLVRALSRKVILGWFWGGIGGPTMVLKWIQNGLTMVLKRSQNDPKMVPPPPPSPSPLPASAKVSCQGAKKI